MGKRVVAVIPARLGSKRFTGKVLYSHHGRPLIYYVWDRVRRAKQIDRLVVATANPDIARAVAAFGTEVVMTSKRHRTGSDRAAEVASKVGGDIVINIQADNFGLKASVLDRVIDRMKNDKKIRCATLARPITRDEELFDPNVVKVVTARDGRALWFSRFPLPYVQGADGGSRVKRHKYLAHVGVYFFRRSLLEAFAEWKRSPLEKAESLEQLRILENGGRIDVIRTSMKTISIDTKEDMQKISSSHR